MKLKRLLAGVVSAAMMLSIGSTLAFAAENTVSYEDGGVTFTSVMNLSKDAVSAPNVEYTYTLSAGTASTYTYENSEGKTITGVIYAGVTTVKTADSSLDTEETVTFATTNYATSEYTVTKDVTFDFSDVNFTEPGIYVYEIKEAQTDPTTAVSGLINESNSTRYVYVTVKNSTAENAIAGDVEITNIVMTSAAITEITVEDGVSSADDKSAGYIHSYGVEGTHDDNDTPDNPDDDPDDEPGVAGGESQDFIVTDTAMGDMANRSKDFSFVAIDSNSIATNTVLKVKDADNNVSYIIKTENGLYFTNETDVPTSGVFTASKDEFGFELASGECYTIYSVVEDMSFTVTISDSADNGYDFYARDYDSTLTQAWELQTITTNQDGSVSAEYTVLVDADYTADVGVDWSTVKGADDGKTDNDNEKEIEYDAAFPETGVVLDLLPYVAMVAIAGAFIAFRVVKSAHKDEE